MSATWNPKNHMDINFFSKLSPLIITRCDEYLNQDNEINIPPSNNKITEYERCDIAAALSVDADYWSIKFEKGSPNYALLGSYDLSEMETFSFTVTNDPKSVFTDECGSAKIILAKDREGLEVLAEAIPAGSVGWFSPYKQSMALKTNYNGPVYLLFRFYKSWDGSHYDGLLIGNIQFISKKTSGGIFLNLARDFRLIYIAKGQVSFKFHHQEQTAEEGHIIISYPFEEYAFKIKLNSEVKAYCVYFYGNNVFKILNHLGLDKQRIIKVHTESVYNYYLESMIREIKEKRDYFFSLANVYFYSLLLWMARYADNNAVCSRYIEVDRAVHIFNTLYFEPISIKQLSQRFCISECWFSRIFTKQVGMPPKEYLLHVRIEKAKDLLIATTHSINEISSMVGYDDQLYFSKRFKKHTGFSPSEFRRKFRLQQ